MTFDPTINYGDKDLAVDENLVYWKFAELIKNLITLSSNAERQFEIIGYGAVADEMAIDFDTYFTIASRSYIDNNLLKINQNKVLMELDKFFEERSGEKSPEFWDDIQLSTNPDWNLVRQQAKEILTMLGFDNLDIVFDREEKFEMDGQEKKLVIQSTKTRLVNKNDSLHGFGVIGAEE